jgi:hypothetical protein
VYSIPPGSIFRGTIICKERPARKKASHRNLLTDLCEIRKAAVESDRSAIVPAGDEKARSIDSPPRIIAKR